MSRTAADRPKGVNGQTFPGYSYKTNPNGNYGSYTTTASQIPADPVLYDCQKNFVIIITDGEPTKDDFRNANTSDQTNQGFSSFGGLIGDFNADGELEIGGPDCVGGAECALYLDDIAKFMQNTDFRPDHPGTQVVDVYTVGFTTSPAGERPALAHRRRRATGSSITATTPRSSPTRSSARSATSCRSRSPSRPPPFRPRVPRTAATSTPASSCRRATTRTGKVT